MNFNKIIILSILLIILAIGAVAASERTSTNINVTFEDVGVVCDDSIPKIDDLGCGLQSCENIDDEFSDEPLSVCGDNESLEKSESSNEVISESEQNFESQAFNNCTHYGYWVNSDDMLNLSLTDLSRHGVTDIFLNFYSYNRYNQSDIESFIADANGIATVSLTAKILKTAKAGMKKLVVKFGGVNYNVGDKTVKITVKKEKTKITAKKKIFRKSNKIKKYSTILKNSKSKPIKKVKVTLKIKGKTYKATTNAKGKAVFKVTKLTKKGKYIAKITFKGNKYYKALTKKVKITIK